MNKQLIEMAANVLHISTEEAEQYWKAIPEYDAYYFWNPIRGGTSVIINAQGEKLGATSSVSFERHLKAFLDGRRN